MDELEARRGTPLTAAAESGQLRVVRYLISAGADTEKCGLVSAGFAPDGGRSRAAYGGGPGGGVGQPRRANSGRTPLSGAALMGHLEIVRVLVESGADVEKSDGWGRTPLIWAAGKGHLEVVRFLVEAAAEQQVQWSEVWAHYLLI